MIGNSKIAYLEYSNGNIKILTSPPLLIILILILFQSCTFQNEERTPLQLINNVLIDGQRLEFKAARLNLTGPVTISNENSHIQAVLELSTDENFEIPVTPGTSIYRLPIFAVNEGYNLPTFPLQNGVFEVIPESLLEEDLSFMEGVNFVAPVQLFLSANSSGEWLSEITGDTGTVQIQFEISNGLVRLTNNWNSEEEGRQITGAVSLPLNLSNFRP
ncbi:MAG: hypothetical protein EA341_05230 [Mongoliibacter sp.]|uniref:hypothetical protein n=1 Tax=Mongoliibacter sp. TaxID=2022438 RepID=UPI0012EF5D93|nr:hypothetical protein [Mongoliibacter sp.]TVP51422.1 MAG: hypothetical protein EA341_05230 [Mongoliibacter sp.]